MNKPLREPLVHFLALGALLFGVATFVKDPGPGSAQQITIAAGTVENLNVSFARSTGRPPTPEERQSLIDDYVREEILNREAIALGLHHDDPIVRRQLRQRMEFLEVGAADPTPPTEAQLQAFFAAHPESFDRPGQATAPDFATVRPAVERAWRSAQRQQVIDAAYARLRARYTVIVEPGASAAAPQP